MRNRIHNLFQQLDERMTADTNDQRLDGELVRYVPIEFRIVGQAALLCADLPFAIAGTVDLDA